MNDLLLDENFDITNEMGEATSQTTEIVVMTPKGTFKQYPTIGVNLLDFLKGNLSNVEIERRVRLEFEVDGAEVTQINFNNTSFQVEAQWKS